MSQNVRIVQYPDSWEEPKFNQFYREVEELAKADVSIILLDFKNITFISSSGLMGLVEIFRLIRSAGCQLFICSVSEQVRMLFELTGLDRVFDVFASVDEFNRSMLIKK